MDTQSIRKIGWLANTGCALGVLSFGFIAYAFIYPFVTTIDKHGLEAPLAIGFAILFFALIGLLLGLAGSVISMIALRRIMKRGGENTSKGIAITGFVLSGLIVAIVCMLFTYFVLSSPVGPLRGLLTPTPFISLTPVQ